VNKRLPLLFRHVMYNLRGGFLVRPLGISLVLGCAGACLSALEETFPAFNQLMPKVLFPSHADPQMAQVILAGIAGSIMTVVSIVFAILLMTLTLASMQFSPRIIANFAKDRTTQWTLGIFLGTFLYCTAALPAARTEPQPFAPVATVLGAMILAVACVGWLLYFIHHISQAISVNYLVDRIASETEQVIDEIMPWPRRRNPPPPDMEPINTWQAPVTAEVSGYIRYIDTKRLVRCAKERHVKVRATRRVGHFIPAGVPILMANREDRLSAAVRAELRGVFDIGPSRTLQQDAEFGVLQIVDIALKAISPAVNDPSTAIGCVDQLSRILIRFASRQPPEPLLYDPPGVLRACVPWIDFDGLAETAFGQIRMYATSDVAVSMRLLRALGDIAMATPDPPLRRALFDRGKQIVEGCARELGGEELRPILARLAELEKVCVTE